MNRLMWVMGVTTVTGSWRAYSAGDGGEVGDSKRTTMGEKDAV
jgi:hypothetical protein